MGMPGSPWGRLSADRETPSHSVPAGSAWARVLPALRTKAAQPHSPGHNWPTVDDGGELVFCDLHVDCLK